ncbi:WD repeat-containing protein, partial [Reticulomyxa filosa]
ENREIDKIIKRWMYLSSVREVGWIKEFTPTYFKSSKVFKRYLGQIKNAKFSPDGTKIVSSSWDATIKIWDIESGDVIKELKGHTDRVNDAQFSFDGTTIVSCSHDNTIRLWDVQSGIEIKTLEGHTEAVTSIDISPDGRFIVSGSKDENIKLWYVQSGQIYETVYIGSSVHDVKFSSNGRDIIVASNWELKMLDLALIERVSSDNKSIGIGTHDLFERVIKTRNENTVMKMHNFCDSRNYFVASCLETGTIQISDIASGTTQYLNTYLAGASDIKYFPDGKTIVACLTDHTIRLWDPRSGEEIQELKGHSGPITSVAVSRNGNAIVSCSQDGTIRLWTPF